jgi:hypothetical protein
VGGFHGDVTFDRSGQKGKEEDQLDQGVQTARRPLLEHQTREQVPMYYVSVHTIQNNNLAACCFCAPRVKFARVPGAVGTAIIYAVTPWGYAQLSNEPVSIQRLQQQLLGAAVLATRPMQCAAEFSAWQNSRRASYSDSERMIPKGPLSTLASRKIIRVQVRPASATATQLVVPSPVCQHQWWQAARRHSCTDDGTTVQSDAKR